ncbi:MAG: hypothetical protein ABIH18_03780 [Candidatus Omnitrophota bacterium]
MLKDTMPKVEEIYINKLKQKTEEERALMGFSMFDTAKTIVRESFEKGMDSKNEKLAIFNKFYSNEFSQETKNKIIKHLSKK